MQNNHDYYSNRAQVAPCTYFYWKIILKQVKRNQTKGYSFVNTLIFVGV